MKKFILFIVCLFISTSVYAGPFIAGGGAGTGDMAEATYSTDGKIKASKGGTGKDSSAWDGCYPSLDAGIWSCDDNDTRMQRLIGLVIGTNVLAPDGSAASLTNFPTLNQNTTGTAAALAANGANCSAGQAPLGVDAAGAVEGCFAVQSSNADLTTIAALTCTENQIMKMNGSDAWVCAADETGTGDNETLINRLIGELAPDITGTPSAHNWAVWTDADSLEGVAVTASKVVCTDGNGQPTACANLTDIVALSSESDPTVGTQVGSGDIDAVSIGDGNFTVDASGNVLMRTASYIRDDENPFCTQYYSGTNYDDNYTEICAPETGYSEIYRLYWPAAAPTGDQVLVFPAPTLGKSQGTWKNLAGGGDLVSTNNLDDVDNATTARRNLGLEIGVDVSAPVTSTEPIINIALRGGGSAISTGSAGNKRIAAAATITGYTITSSASCSITVDLWKTTYTAYDVSTHPVDGDSITASAPITLTTAVKAKDETLTGWTKTLSADDIIHVNVDSADCTGDVDIQVYGTRSL